jgi:hypothetical protein
MNLRFVQLVEECHELSVEEQRILIKVLNEELLAEIKPSWRKREIAERIEREEYQND